MIKQRWNIYSFIFIFKITIGTISLAHVLNYESRLKEEQIIFKR